MMGLYVCMFTDSNMDSSNVQLEMRFKSWFSLTIPTSIMVGLFWRLTLKPQSKFCSITRAHSLQKAFHDHHLYHHFYHQLRSGESKHPNLFWEDPMDQNQEPWHGMGLTPSM